MKKKLLVGLLTVTLASLMLLSGCGNKNAGTEDLSEKVTCNNGVMVGVEEDGIMSYKGIPYAKAPVGDLRWKAPVEAEDSTEEIQCDKFGDTALQYEWPTEPASYEKKSEDCLSLNIWTSKKQTDKPKSVMVWFHGGAHSWGGTADPMYDGQKFAEAHPDIILVTCNYRLGLMAWPDFSDFPGGEEYTDVNLGIRDNICALQWIQKNIENFGGDPENVTIFGESAGGWTTSALVVSPMAKGLFQKAIAESGILTPEDRQDAKDFAKYIADAAGCKTMSELKKITADEWVKLDSTEWIADESCGIVYDGEVIPKKEDMDDAIKDAAKRGIVILTGANAQEWNYFCADAEGDTKAEKFASWKENLDNVWDSNYKKADAKGKKMMKDFYKEVGGKVAKEYAEDSTTKDALIKSQLITEAWRQTHTDFESTFSDAGGTAYMYYWNVPSISDEYYKSACHAVELSYVFNNDDDIYCGSIDKKTQERTQEAWSNFAKTGDPSIEGTEWTTYDTDKRETMVIGKKSWEMKSDPVKTYRQLMSHLGTATEIMADQF